MNATKCVADICLSSPNLAAATTTTSVNTSRTGSDRRPLLPESAELNGA